MKTYIICDMKIHRFYTIFLIILLIFSCLSLISNNVFPSNAQTQQNLRIVLKQPLQSIGADGGEYPIYIEIENNKGEPVELNNDLKIELFSSDTRVGDVPREAVLKSGSFYTVANFKTTNTPGSTFITAMASGFQSGSLLIKTDYSVGYPKKLMVYAYPDKLLPSPAEEANIVVELQDILGKTARAPEDIEVSLSSSNTFAGNILDGKVTIPKGKTYVIARFKPSNIPGSTVITASASGYESGSTTISTVGPTPEKIVVTAAPSKLPSDGKSYIFITAYLVDNQVFPAKADKDIKITFTCSNTSLAYFKTTQLIIHPGEFSVQNKLYSTNINLKGTVEITAQASDLKSSKTYVSILPPADEETGVLKVYGAPFIFPPGPPPNKTYYNAVVVQIENQSGYPIITDKPITVYLSSSNTLYGYTIQNYIVISSGQSIGAADFNTTKFVGSTVITASADNFKSSQITINTYAPPPSKLKLGIGPPTIRASGKSYPFLYIQLQDKLGRPATAQEDILVHLSSSNEEHGIVSFTILIKNGDSFEYINFTSTNFPGETNITASAEGYETDTLLVKTIEPFSSILSSKAYTEYVGDGGEYPLYIQLLDSFGRPARPELPVEIFLTSSNPSIINVTKNVVLDEGAPYVVAKLTTSKIPGKTTVSLAAPGYQPISIVLESIVLPLNLTISSQKTSIDINETLQITVSTDFLGVPVKDVNLYISSLNGEVVGSGWTDADGLFKFTYKPLKPGEDTIKILARKPGYVDAYAEHKIYVDKYINLKIHIQTDDGSGIAGINVKVTDGGNNTKNIVSDSNGTVYASNIKWGNITVTVENSVKKNMVKYLFSRWEDGREKPVWKNYLENDSEITAIYKVQYYVSVESPYGSTYGSGWYGKGTSISIGVEKTIVPVSYIQSKKFNSWNGDIISKKPQASVVVDSPKKIIAIWVDDYTKLYYLIGVIAAIIAIIIVGILYYKGLILKRFRRKAVEEEEETEEEF